MRLNVITLALAATLPLAGCEDREREERGSDCTNPLRGTRFSEDDTEASKLRDLERAEKEYQQSMQFVIDRQEVLGLVETALQESVELDGRWSAFTARVMELNDKYDADELFREKFAADTRHRTIWWELRRGAPEYIRKALGYVEVLRDLKAKLHSEDLVRPKRCLSIVYAAHDHHVTLAAAIDERNRALKYMEGHLARVSRPVIMNAPREGR